MHTLIVSRGTLALLFYSSREAGSKKVLKSELAKGANEWNIRIGRSSLGSVSAAE